MVSTVSDSAALVLLTEAFSLSRSDGSTFSTLPKREIMSLGVLEPRSKSVPECATRTLRLTVFAVCCGGAPGEGQSVGRGPVGRRKPCRQKQCWWRRRGGRGRRRRY